MAGSPTRASEAGKSRSLQCRFRWVSCPSPQDSSSVRVPSRCRVADAFRSGSRCELLPLLNPLAVRPTRLDCDNRHIRAELSNLPPDLQPLSLIHMEAIDVIEIHALALWQPDVIRAVVHDQ